MYVSVAVCILIMLVDVCRSCRFLGWGGGGGEGRGGGGSILMMLVDVCQCCPLLMFTFADGF